MHRAGLPTRTLRASVSPATKLQDPIPDLDERKELAMSTIAMRPSRVLRRTLFGTGAVSLALLIGTANPSQASSMCMQVRGGYVEHSVSENCLSPVGLCIAGTYSGQIRGDFEGRATSIIPTADTPATGAALFTSDSTINATIMGRTGTLIVKNAGAFAAGNGGPIVDLQTIVGGTDQLAGATGALRATGTFSTVSGGQSQYQGTVCIPS
jgi:Protein of unknown function (DUF3224)